MKKSIMITLYLLSLMRGVASDVALVRRETLSKDDDEGVLVYHLTQNIGIIIFELEEDQVNAFLYPTQMEWAIGYNTIPNIQCSGLVRYFVNNPNSVNPENLFITRISGEYSLCGESGGGSGGGGSGGGGGDERLFEYSLVGSTLNSAYIFPPVWQIDLDEWLELNALKSSDHSATSLKWSVSNDGKLYETTDLTQEIDSADSYSTTYFRSSKTGLFTFNLDVAGTSFATSIPAEIEVLGDVNLLPVDDDSRPNLDAGLICINAQDEYKRAKWKAEVKDGDDFAFVTVESGDVKFEDDAETLMVFDQQEFWVYSDGEHGTYKLKIRHPQGDVTKYAESKQFEFVVRAKDEGVSDPTSTNISLSTHSPSVIKPGVQANSPDTIVFDFHTRSISNKSHRESRIETMPEGVYNGNVKATTKIIGSQRGVLTAWGTVGINPTGTPIAISGSSLSWNGKITFSGGGMAAPIVRDDGGKQANAPNLILLMLNANIRHSFETEPFERTFTINEWMKIEAEIEVEGHKNGVAQTLGAGYFTRDGILVEPLYINAGTGIPEMNNFKIIGD